MGTSAAIVAMLSSERAENKDGAPDDIGGGTTCARASSAALILSLESVFAAFFGWWILSEILVFIAIIGCVLIFIAVILAEVVSERQIKSILKIFYKP